MSELKKKLTDLYAAYKRLTHTQTESEEMEEGIPLFRTNGNQKKARVAILILGKIYFIFSFFFQNIL